MLLAATGSGKTLCYALPLLSFLGLFDKKPLAARAAPDNAVIVTPTTELALQVSSVLTSLLDSITASSKNSNALPSIKVVAVTPAQNLHLLSAAAAPMTSNYGEASTIFVGSAKTINLSCTKSQGELSPTPPPLVQEFYRRCGFLVLDEVRAKESRSDERYLRS